MLDPRRIWSSSQLPSLPSVAIRLLEMSKDPETELRDVIALIKTDPAISAKILKSANSSFFGLSSKVASVDRAVPLLGTTVVTSLALSFSLVEAAMTSGPLVPHYSAYWLQSVVHASAAEVLSGYRKDGLECEYFLSGLLMDLGRLAMLKTIPGEYLPVLEQAQREQRPLHAVESEQFGFDHVEIGVKLMENWSMPDSLIEAVRWHHAPSSELLASPQAASPLVRAVSVAAAAGDYFCSEQKGTAWERLQLLGGEFFGLNESELQSFLAQAKDRVEQAGDLFSVNARELRDPSELMAEANEQLAHLALREHVAGAQAAAHREQIEREKRELESKNRELQQQASSDPLTGLYNRKFFGEALEKELSRCRRTGATIGVIFSDIDRFKQLNDTYGHQFGDHVLVRVAEAFRKMLRTIDVLARFGGEEFVVLLIEPTLKGLERVAERLRAGIETEEILFQDQRVPVTVSLGAALAIPSRTDAHLAERLIAQADEAMYDSKRNGRNQVHVRSLLSERELQLLTAAIQRRFSRWLVARNVLDIATTSELLLQCRPERQLIGTLARRQGLLDAAQIDEILEIQQETSERFGEIAVRLGWLADDQLAQLLALQQEDPLLLAKALIATHTLPKPKVAELLREYLAETSWTGGAVTAANAAGAFAAV